MTLNSPITEEMTRQIPAVSRNQRRGASLAVAILALALGSFAIGITEFSMMGLLQEAVADLGIDLSQGGNLVSAYALGAVVGGPLLSVVTARIERRTLVISLLGLFVLGHALSLLAPTYGLLLAGRFLSGLPHGAYLAGASLLAAGLVGPAKRARAASWVMVGLSIANVVGVPVVTWLGQNFGWRWMLGVALGAAVVTGVMIRAVIPAQPVGASVSMRNELSALRSPRLWLAILLAIVGFSGMFALYAYIAPVLTETAGLAPSMLPFALAIYGVGMVVGNMLGGRLADISVLGTVAGAMAVLMVSLLLFSMTADVLPLALLFMTLVGISGQSLAPALQMHLIDCAPHAPQISSALTHSAFNLANAFGAWFGGAVIGVGWGLGAPSLLGGLAALLGTGMAVAMLVAQRSRAAARG
ncbi:MFS transporter [Rothia sp. AR01]|uniref:MFS transporter n=1 Tax=Rothia santali TaxID=2949643 RepID=A0A9X2KHL0_9MICC|nr:MFS transporter [Rothia santali]MCP3425020.1 MFS transporter [Rothia santali]